MDAQEFVDRLWRNSLINTVSKSIMITRVNRASSISRLGAAVCIAASAAVFFVPIHVVAQSHSEIRPHDDVLNQQPDHHDHSSEHHSNHHEDDSENHGKDHSVQDHLLGQESSGQVAGICPVVLETVATAPEKVGHHTRSRWLTVPCSCTDRASPDSPRSPPSA